MRRTLGRSWATAYVIAALLGAAVAGATFWAWSERNQAYASEATLQVLGLPGTGDPDRVIATQISIIESESQHRAVMARLDGPAEFSTSAAQVRLSNVVLLTAESPDATVALAAASAAAEEYIASAAIAQPAQVQVSLLDAATPGRLVGSPVRDTALAALAGATVTIAALMVLFTLRPRVRDSYTVAPVDAVLFELPLPGSRRSRRDHALAADLRRLGEHLAASRDPSGRSGLSFTVSALPGVRRRSVRWTAEVLRSVGASSRSIRALHDGDSDGERSAPSSRVSLVPLAPPGVLVTMADSTVPDPATAHGAMSVVLARAWVDSARTLEKDVTSRAVFSDVVVIVLGARRSALVVPPSGHVTAGPSVAEGESRRSRRGHDAAWR